MWECVHPFTLDPMSAWPEADPNDVFILYMGEGRERRNMIYFLEKTYTNIWLSGYLAKWVSMAPLARLQSRPGPLCRPMRPFLISHSPPTPNLHPGFYYSLVLGFIVSTSTQCGSVSSGFFFICIQPYLVGFCRSVLFSDHLFLVIVCALEPRWVHLVALQTPRLWLYCHLLMSFVNLVFSGGGGAVNPAQILGTHWTRIPERRPNVRWVVLEQRISFSFSHPILIKALWRTELVYINSLASLGRDSECPWMRSVRIVAGPKRLLGIISNHWVISSEWDRESAHSPAIWVVLVRERQAHPVEFMRFGILVMKKFAESIHA